VGLRARVAAGSEMDAGAGECVWWCDRERVARCWGGHQVVCLRRRGPWCRRHAARWSAHLAVLLPGPRGVQTRPPALGLRCARLVYSIAVSSDRCCLTARFHREPGSVSAPDHCRSSVLSRVSLRGPMISSSHAPCPFWSVGACHRIRGQEPGVTAPKIQRQADDIGLRPSYQFWTRSLWARRR
jgi:hypothetical protein